MDLKDTIELNDADMINTLHNLARTFEQDLDTADLGTVLRRIAGRLKQLSDKASTRRHWTGQE